MNSTFKLPDKHTQQHHVSSVETSSKEPRLLEDKLQVVLLASVLGDGRSEFEVDSHTGSSNKATSYPHEKRQTDTTRQRQNAARSGEDTGSDHAVEDEEGSADHADLALVRSCFGMLTFACFVQSVKSTNELPSKPLTSNTITLVAILVSTSLHDSRAEDLLFLLSSHT